MEVQRIPKRTVSVIEPQKSILVDKEKYHVILSWSPIPALPAGDVFISRRMYVRGFDPHK